MMRNSKKILICGIITGILFIILDMLVAIVSMPVFASHADLPIFKNQPNVTAGLIFDMFNGLLLVIVYSSIYKGIPGKGWKKGSTYGIIVGLFRVLMNSFSTVVMYNIPLILVITSLVTGFVEIVVLCTIMSIIYEKIE